MNISINLPSIDSIVNQIKSKAPDISSFGNPESIQKEIMNGASVIDMLKDPEGYMSKMQSDIESQIPSVSMPSGIEDLRNINESTIMQEIDLSGFEEIQNG